MAGTTVRTIHWVEHLAQQDRRLHDGERGAFDLTAAKEGLLRHETASFLRELESHLAEMTDHFNRFVGSSHLQVRLQRADGPSGEFSLHRGTLRLEVGARKPGAVRLQCDKLIASDSARPSTRSSVMFCSVIEASFGAFDEVSWGFLGSPVSAELVARHHFTEFVQMSRSAP
jgi:hypothetical protein